MLTFSIALLVLEAPKLAQEFLLAMSTVKTVMSPKPHFLKFFFGAKHSEHVLPRQGILDPELYWGKAVQHWGHARLPALASAVWRSHIMPSEPFDIETITY